MKGCLIGMLLLALTSCNNEGTEDSFTTVDSNVAGSPDSIPATLHLDQRQGDTSFPVALDSAGPTINPQDTNYRQKQ
jgi:hypothetical protein